MSSACSSISKQRPRAPKPSWITALTNWSRGHTYRLPPKCGRSRTLLTPRSTALWQECFPISHDLKPERNVKEAFDIIRARSYHSDMPFKFRPIILLLALALLIQNTCPFGAAGKSTVSYACGHCQMKHAVTASPIGQKQLVSDSASVHFPLYVFA